MSHQTKMNGAKPRMSSTAGVKRNLTGLGIDLLSLAELQFQLLQLDLRDTRSQSRLPLMLLGMGVLLAFGALPIFLLAIGWSLIHLAGLPEHLAFLAVGSAGLLIAIGVLWCGWRTFWSALEPLKRSQQEFQDNMRLMNQALRRRAGACSSESPDVPLNDSQQNGV